MKGFILGLSLLIVIGGCAGPEEPPPSPSEMMARMRARAGENPPVAPYHDAQLFYRSLRAILDRAGEKSGEKKVLPEGEKRQKEKLSVKRPRAGTLIKSPDNGPEAKAPDQGPAELDELEVSPRPGPSPPIRSKPIQPGTLKKSAPAEGHVSVAPAALYQEAFVRWQAGKHSRAQKLFERFLELFPRHPLSDNALYWMGECWYARSEYRLACQAFEGVLERYPEGNKIADSLLKLGLCYSRLQKAEKSRRYWQTLIQDHPETRAATLARRFLNRS